MQVWALTNRGRVRKTNQDTFYYDDNGYATVALVCDGMGGAAAGEVASRLAAESFADNLHLPSKNIPEKLLWAVDWANRAVLDHARIHPECAGMGTTLVAAVVVQDVAYVINVGDSRCYYMDGGGIRQVTRDHSFVANLVRQGAITPEQARTHPKKSSITRALGFEEDCRPELFQVKLQPDGMLLLCSDGLTNQVSDQEILFEALYGDRPSMVCKRLVEKTLKRGAPDNVTVVFLAP